MKVLVVGGSGMLGSALVSVLTKNATVEVLATYRTPWSLAAPAAKKWFMFHAGMPMPPSVQVGPGDWVVNAAGAIPHRKPDDLDMIRSNVLLPYELAELCAMTGARMIHVTTDCVFSGSTPPGKTSLNKYKEGDVHDSREFYGRTKSMGEVLHNKSVFNLRCSIIGPEPRGRSHSLMEWLLSRPRMPVVGFEDHLWNGVTTLALSKVIEGIVLYDADLEFGKLPRLHHLVPKGHTSKFGLLKMIAEEFGEPVNVEPHSVGGVDRTLGTMHQDLNNRLWSMAGFPKPPSIESMVSDLARWVRSGGYPFKETT